MLIKKALGNMFLLIYLAICFRGRGIVAEVNRFISDFANGIIIV